MLEIENPENEYAKQNPTILAGYTAQINYMKITKWLRGQYENESTNDYLNSGEYNTSSFYEITSLLGFSGIKYTFKNNTLNITVR